MTAEQFAAIPAELKACNNWVCWKAIPDQSAHSGVRKVPINPRTGGNASTNKPETWTSFDAAAAAAITQGYAGIGFVFANSGFFGVDLDDIGDEAGQLDRSEAAAIVNALQTYTERSQSGRGVHCIARGSLPGADMRRGKVEMYAGNRFFVMTGDRLPGTAAAVNDCTESIKPIYDRYQTRPAAALPDQMPAAAQTVRTGAADQPGERWTDSAVIDAATRYNPQFAALYRGDMTAYSNNQSNAVRAFLLILAYWTDCDAVQIDRIYRGSGLYYAKWDRPQSGSTWGALEIEKVIAKTGGKTRSSDRRPHTVTAEAAALADDQSGGSSMPAALPTAQQMRPDSIAAYMDGGQFGAELTAYSSRKSTPTGFAELDRRTAGGLYPGLYVIGGLPGAGKTTFCAQLADQISAAGRDVLFFSLEMSRLEMISKSLARLCAQKHGTADALTALAIRCGQGAGLVREAAAEYRRTAAGRLSIIESEATTAAGICDYVRAYIAAGNPAPVVIIDYLQLLAAGETSKQTAKEATDKAMRELKLLSRRAQITVIAISSLNRDNYTKSLALDALKESGGVEYSADVVAGLQFRIMRSKPTAQQIETAKTQNPRELELKIIKNRFGQLFGAELDYFPHCDLFREPAAATAAAELAADQSGDQTSSKGGGDTWTATATG